MGEYEQPKASIEVGQSSFEKKELERECEARHLAVVRERESCNSDPRCLAREMLESIGWGSQWGCLDSLVWRESRWDASAQNPRSTAYGLFQFLSSTRAQYPVYNDGIKGQLEGGLEYVRDRYGDACGAWSFWQSNHYY